MKNFQELVAAYRQLKVPPEVLERLDQRLNAETAHRDLRNPPQEPARKTGRTVYRFLAAGLAAALMGFLLMYSPEEQGLTAQRVAPNFEESRLFLDHHVAVWLTPVVHRERG
jgi:ferric-dicitrate binding protein FerR (iron transport regulator)